MKFLEIPLRLGFGNIQSNYGKEWHCFALQHNDAD